MSKDSFQYGFRVFLMTDVVLVCSPPRVATAKGSGKPKEGYQPWTSAIVTGDMCVRTENIALVKSIRRNDYFVVSIRTSSEIWRQNALVTLKFSRLRQARPLARLHEHCDREEDIQRQISVHNS